MRRRRRILEQAFSGCGRLAALAAEKGRAEKGQKKVSGTFFWPQERFSGREKSDFQFVGQTHPA
jgi:hypothetical protein